MKVVNRIKENKEFACAIKNGRSIRAESFTLHVLKNNFGHARVGISVSKKIGNAVVRNHIKRQIRAMCNTHINYASTSLDIAIVVRRSYIDKDYQTNSELLKKALSNVI